jgi:ligand-binding sensor domain-containing protein
MKRRMNSKLKMQIAKLRTGSLLTNNHPDSSRDPSRERSLDSRFRGNDGSGLPCLRRDDVIAVPRRRTSHLGLRTATIVAAFLVHHSLFITVASAQKLQDTELASPISDRPLPIRVTNLGVEHGLSMSVGYTIFQDRYGFMWIGGQNGVNRFDGYEVKVYKSEPFNPKSFTDGWIIDIDEDEEGNLWFATFVGVTKMDRVTETFTHYRHDPSDPESIASNITFVVEPNGDGRMWISTRGGLDLLDPASGKAEHFQNDPADSASISHNFVSDAIKDASGDFWFATVNGVNRLNRDRLGSFSSYLVSPEGYTPSSDFRAILERSVEPGVLWLVARDGLVRFDPETGDT